MHGEAHSPVALIVDDETFARLFAVQILLDHGFTVLEAGDAAEALDVLDRNDDVSLLFTDISMPGEVDGLGLVHHVSSEKPEVAIILTSGNVQPDGVAPPAAAFLPKPYTAHSLLSAISEALPACK